MSDNGRVNAPETTSYVKNVIREKRTSKAGKEYQVLVITFDNGYVLESFLNNEQIYILNHIPLF